MKYFNKPLEKVTTEELRNYLMKLFKDERKLSDRSINYYNSLDVDIKKIVKTISKKPDKN